LGWYRLNVKKVIEKLKGRKPSILGQAELFKYSVLLPLIEIENETHILFEVRSMTLRRQPGEICFPGGRIDETDADQRQCAIRETSEELGIEESDIEDVIPLDFTLNASSNIIYPFVGRITKPEQINPNESEVEEVFTVPLSYFQKTKPEVYKIYYQVVPEEGFPLHLIPGGENYKWSLRHLDEYFYQYKGHVIWGLTARVLYHFIELLEVVENEN